MPVRNKKNEVLPDKKLITEEPSDKIIINENIKLTNEEKNNEVIKYINETIIKSNEKNDKIAIKELYKMFNKITKINMMLFKFINVLKEMNIPIEKTNVYYVVGYKLKSN